jgi:hypothetical protein
MYSNSCQEETKPDLDRSANLNLKYKYNINGTSVTGNTTNTGKYE